MGADGADTQDKIDERYSRQLLFPAIGKDGQRKLLASRILVVGCGALGCAQAEMFARAGVGHIRIVDRDFVEYTNLQRQTLFTENDARERLPKAVAAKQRLTAINSSIKIEGIVADVNNSNVAALVDGCDVVVDATDNFQTRYLLNDACVRGSVPWIYGAAVASYGSTMTIVPGETPCLRCIFDEMPDAGSSPTCDTAGVIMPIIQSIASIQVTEAIKLITGQNEALHRSLMQIDVWSNDRHRIALEGPEPDCKTCGRRDFEFLDADRGEFAAVLCGRDAVQIAPSRSNLNLKDLAERLSSIGEVRSNDHLVRFTAEGAEITIFADGRAIIKGTDDIPTARSLYARYIGS